MVDPVVGPLAHEVPRSVDVRAGATPKPETGCCALLRTVRVAGLGGRSWSADCGRAPSGPSGVRRREGGPTRRPVPGILKALCLINPGETHTRSPPSPLSSQIETCCGIPSLRGLKSPSTLISSFKELSLKSVPSAPYPLPSYRPPLPPSLLSDFWTTKHLMQV